MKIHYYSYNVIVFTQNLCHMVSNVPVNLNQIALFYLFIPLDFGLDWTWVKAGINSVMVLKHRSLWLAGKGSLPELKTVGKLVSIRGKHQRTETRLCSQAIKWPVKKLDSQPWPLATMSKHHYVIHLPKYGRDSWLGDGTQNWHACHLIIRKEKRLVEPVKQVQS